MDENEVLEIGQYYWISDRKRQYTPAKLIDFVQKGSIINYRLELYDSNSNLVVVDKSAIFGRIPQPVNEYLNKLPHDLVDSDDVSEPSILWTIEKRFMNNMIYSGIGSIIVAVNPYKMIDNLYSNELLQKYLSMQSMQTPGINNYKLLPPHVWTIAQNAFGQLQTNYCKQAIIISGESGAGKTEATKKCLQYLSAISSLNSPHQAGTIAIEDRVLGTNPLLESFGMFLLYFLCFVYYFSYFYILSFILLIFFICLAIDCYFMLYL